MEQLFSDTGKQATQDFEPWEKDTPQVPWSSSSLPRENFLIAV